MVLYADRLLVLEQAAPVYHGDPWRYFRENSDPRLGRPMAYGYPMGLQPGAGKSGV